jgi:hypothetical protein
MEDNNVLILTLVGSLTSITLLCLKLMFKSKCKETECCCGVIRFKRDVQLETELENAKERKTQPNTIGQPSMYISESNTQQQPQNSEDSV